MDGVRTLLPTREDLTIDARPFSELTTFRCGGRPRATVHCSTSAAAITAVKLLDAADIPLVIVGGGSNLLVADKDLDVVAVVLEEDDFSIDASTGVVRVRAGATWDDVVAATVEAGLGGIECLSGIPGSAGATPVQNVGAYGAEVGSVLTRVRVWDRQEEVERWLPVGELELGYRYSNLKFTHRAVVLEIELQLRPGGESSPLRFGELARRLGATHPDQRFPVAQVRQQVLELRRAKGMVVDPEDHDTWSAGSFFTNPVVSDTLADAVFSTAGGEKMPRFPAGDGLSKLSAAWLIERAGFPKGYPGEGAPARLSTKHTLALTNRGTATTGDVVQLARTVRDGVRDTFGVTLQPEPVWVGVALD